MVARAREQGLLLTGPDGLLKQLTETLLEIALNEELTSTWATRKRSGQRREQEGAQRHAAVAV